MVTRKFPTPLCEAMEQHKEKEKEITDNTIDQN